MVTNQQWKQFCKAQSAKTFSTRLCLLKDSDGWWLHDPTTTDDAEIPNSENMEFRQASIAAAEMFPDAEIILSC